MNLVSTKPIEIDRSASSWQLIQIRPRRSPLHSAPILICRPIRLDGTARTRSCRARPSMGPNVGPPQGSGGRNRSQRVKRRRTARRAWSVSVVRFGGTRREPVWCASTGADGASDRLGDSYLLRRRRGCATTIPAQNPHNGGSVAGVDMVGVRGFEPPAPCSQSRCATGLRHTPYLRECYHFSRLRGSSMREPGA